MAELAFIHPLLVRNPLPADRLRSSRARAASACALAGECFDGLLLLALPELPAMAAHDSGARGHALAWRDSLGPALGACLEGVAAFARRHNESLAPLLLAAADAEVDPAARRKLAAGFAALRSGAEAEQEIARQGALAADAMRRACARDFVAFVVEADALRRALAPGQQARMAFELAIDARQRAMGDAMAMVAGAVDAFGALEGAWRELGAGFKQLAGQSAATPVNGALLLARLNAARAEWCTLGEIAQLPPALRACSEAPAPAAATGSTPGSAAALVASVDSCAQRIAAMPAPQGAGVPAALRHIGVLQQLALAWPQVARAGQLAALRALKDFGERLHAEQGACEPGALAPRLADIARLLETASAELGGYLARLGMVARQIQADTALLNGRLRVSRQQADTIQAGAASLQRRLDGARARQRWLWRLGPLSSLMTQEIDHLEDKLKNSAGALHALRGAQAVTLDDAACLQGLLPALSGLLEGAERLRASMIAALLGIQMLQSRLASGGQLQPALADWQVQGAAAGLLA